MSLFKEPIEKIDKIIMEASDKDILKRSDYNRFAVWPEKQSLVLQDDTLLELGSASSSLFMILWTGQGEKLSRYGVSIVGNDLSDVKDKRIPFAQIILIEGDFEDQYESYRDLRDVIFDTKPEGVSARIWPDRQKIWCRVSKEAAENGFTLEGYGNTLLKKLQDVKSVKGAEVIFITDALQEMKSLIKVSEKVHDIVEALIKMYEEMNFDCDDCEYIDVCEEVAGLREIRERLRREREKK